MQHSGGAPSWNVSCDPQKLVTLPINLYRRRARSGQEGVRSIIATAVGVDVCIIGETRKLFPVDFNSFDKEANMLKRSLREERNFDESSGPQSSRHPGLQGPEQLGRETFAVRLICRAIEYSVVGRVTRLVAQRAIYGHRETPRLKPVRRRERVCNEL